MTHFVRFYLLHGVLILNGHIIHRRNVSNNTLGKIVNETHFHATKC